MTPTLITAIITITLALVFYTIGVWSEHRRRRLMWRDVVFFLLGLAMDTTGTSLMARMVAGAAASDEAAGGALMSLHGITGAIAILLMLAHAIWAIAVMLRDRETERTAFHRFSLLVWFIWLVPYILGMMMGMRG